jgi:hypothetical protein
MENGGNFNITNFTATAGRLEKGLDAPIGT